MKYTAHEWVAAAMADDSSPDSYAVGTDEICELDCRGYRELLWVFLLGTFAATATVVFQARECATPGGTFADVVGALAPATGTYTAGTDDDRIFVGSLNLMERMRYQNMEYTIDNDAIEMAVVGIKFDKVEVPVSQSRPNVFSIRS